MLSGDTQAAQGISGPFSQLLHRFALHWTRIDVLCPPVAQPVEGLGRAAVYFHPNPGRKWQQPLFIARQGAALLAQRDYALMVSHDYGLFLNGWGAYQLQRRFDLPWVSELHHIEGYPIAVTQRERMYRWLARHYIRRVKKRVRGFRVVNRGEMPPLLRSLAVPEEKILVLPSLYLDFELFRPLPELAPRYDFLFVGRLASNKGLPLLLDALAQLAAAQPAVQMALLGEGPLRPQLEQQIKRLGLGQNIHFLLRAATTAELVAIYNQSRVLVCSSTSEGGPRVTVEAMACGLPVLSTPVGVMGELLRGTLAPLRLEWDAAAIAAKMRWLLEDESAREHYGKLGRQAVQQFEAATMIDQYAQSYQRLVMGG